MNILLIILFGNLFVNAMNILEIGFLFLSRALGIIWFDYDWAESFHAWYIKMDERLKEKERIREEKNKIAEEEAREIYIIGDEK